MIYDTIYYVKCNLFMYLRASSRTLIEIFILEINSEYVTCTYVCIIFVRGELNTIIRYGTRGETRTTRECDFRA